MKKLIFCLGFALLVAGLSVSCGNSTGEVSKQDSLSIENQRLNEFLDIVAYTMDSINGQEKYLYMNKDGMPITNKEQIRNNIRIFKYNLEEQQKRVAELVEQKNFNIAQLQTHVQTLSGRVDQLEVEAEEASANLETAKTELAQATVGYVIMGTKKELTAAGVLKGKFLLQKKKVDMENLDVSKFKSVDIRSISTIDIPGRDAKVLSAQVPSSFSITEDKDTKTSQLKIQNASQFWESSRYLIIQYK